jgi:hypothetical protein
MSGKLKFSPAITELDPRQTGPCRGPDDPLLNAVIWKLPNIGQPFSISARQKWLEMIAMAFDVAYGAADGIPPSPPSAVQQSAPAPKPAPHTLAGSDIYVDEDGYARSDFRKDEQGRPHPTPKRRVLADEVDAAEPIYDYRGVARDRTTVIWGDDQIGAGPGMSFCGPG